MKEFPSKKVVNAALKRLVNGIFLEAQQAIEEIEQKIKEEKERRESKT